MTVLSIAADVCAECGLEIPLTVATSTDRKYVELMEVMNDAADHIARHHDWQSLTSEVGFTGNGVAEAFVMPFNFDRLKEDVKPWNTTTNLPLVRVRETSKWHELQRTGFDPAFQHSIILNNWLHVQPVLAQDQVVQLYFISNNIFQAQDGTYHRNAIADTDTFRLDERALKLFTIAFWKRKNGQASAADELKKGNAYLADLVSTDKGERKQSVVKVADGR